MVNRLNTDEILWINYYSLTLFLVTFAQSPTAREVFVPQFVALWFHPRENPSGHCLLRVICGAKNADGSLKVPFLSVRINTLPQFLRLLLRVFEIDE